MSQGTISDQELDQTLRAIFNNAVDAICVHRDGRYVLVNPAYFRLFGYADMEDLSRIKVLDTIAPQCRDEVANRIADRHEGKSQGGEYVTTGLRQDGTTFDLQIHATTYGLDGLTYTLAIVRDVTSIREAEARQRLLFDSSPDPTWIMQDNRFVECNAAAVRFLGYASKDELLGVHPSRLSPEFQSDGESSFTKAERMMRVAAESGIHRFEWTHLRADGREFLAEVTLSAISVNGRPGLHCVWRDITDRKKAETQLQMAASVFHASQEGILITNRNGIILSVNPAFTAITGYEPEEVIGQTPRVLKSNHHDAAFYAEMWRKIIDTGGWQGEVWNRRKNGEAYLESLTIAAISDEADNHVRFVSVFSDITESRRKDEQIRHQAYHDALTGLPNRALLDDRLDHAIQIARRQSAPVAVLFLDLDRFKVINDSLGHQEGDKLLQVVARRLEESVRKSDTVGRLGGDEFIVILTDFADAAEVAQVAEKIIAALAEPCDLAGHEVHTGTSVGIAVFPDDGEDAVTVMKNADIAMYQAKTAGRGSFRFFDSSMNHKAVERLEMEANLRQALAQNQFELFYQPKIQSSSGRLSGAEALIRWRKPDGTLVAPGDFIPLAEETGLIVPIGYWVLGEVCRQIARWRAAGLPQTVISINMSPRQFGDDALVERVAEIMAECGADSAALEFELTETTVMENPAEAIHTLRKLRDLGIRVSVDDFGTGYSSLAYLRRFPINAIKIDRSFVADLSENPGDSAIIQSIVGLAGSLNLEVVAEGVETGLQLAIVNDVGCDVIQGYYYSRPTPAAEFAAWIERGGEPKV